MDDVANNTITSTSGIISILHPQIAGEQTRPNVVGVKTVGFRFFQRVFGNFVSALPNCTPDSLHRPPTHGDEYA